MSFFVCVYGASNSFLKYVIDIFRFDGQPNKRPDQSISVPQKNAIYIVFMLFHALFTPAHARTLHSKSVIDRKYVMRFADGNANLLLRRHAADRFAAAHQGEYPDGAPFGRRNYLNLHISCRALVPQRCIPNNNAINPRVFYFHLRLLIGC